MNNRIFHRCVEISKAIRPLKITGKSFHTSFALKKSKIVCVGWNNYAKPHNHVKFGKFENWRKFPGEYKPSLHSEISLCIKLGEEDLSDYEIMNVRIGNNDQIALSMPCPNCLRIISSLSPKRLFHSNNNNGYEELIIK